jgi:guanosine-3',5'-bis(diphosphate) 3'-pyrophosphohydrolase
MAADGAHRVSANTLGRGGLPPAATARPIRRHGQALQGCARPTRWRRSPTRRHLGQFRASGEPYITHPIAVAGLCADWKLDVQAIMAALMHDTIEDLGITKAELIERFGAPTAELVDGLTKLDKLQFNTREEGQAESFRKMLLAMARDVRVILIKLADRLHNMRTMAAMAPDKRQRIARETLDIYAPIAHRLGLNQTYRELQELSFEHLCPWRHAALAKAVQGARGHRRDIVERVRQRRREGLLQRAIKAR